MSLRVTVADDAVLFREGLARLLSDAGFEVTATVGSADALLAQVDAHLPDVAVVDIRMPPTHTTEGLEAARSAPAPSLASPTTSKPSTVSNCRASARNGAWSSTMSTRIGT